MAILATKIIEYISEFKVTQGDLAGEDFELLTWQERLIRSMYDENAKIIGVSVARVMLILFSGCNHVVLRAAGAMCNTSRGRGHSGVFALAKSINIRGYTRIRTTTKAGF